ncbi:MAG: dihydroorotase [Acidobacteriota bacterium]
MESLLLKGGRVVDPATDTDAVLDLLIVDGRIADRRPPGEGGASGAPSGARVLDVEGLVVCPGFIDMHVHLREPGQEHKETIESGTRAAATGGFTSVACMPNTDPWNDGLAVTEYIVTEARRRGAVNVFPVGCVTKGGRGEELAEIGDMVRSGVVAVSDDGHPVSNAHLMRMALEYTRMFGIPVIDHCEDRSLSRGAAMNEGATATRLGLKGMPAASEEIAVGRDLALVRLTGGRLHIAHLSTRGAIERVRRAKEEGLSVTCEVTPHHLTLTEAAVRDSEYDTNTKVNPPLRSEEDRLALLEGIRDGTVDVIATDHAPHHRDEKMREYDDAPFGLIGLETAVPVLMDRLVAGGGIDLPLLVRLMSVNPARVLGLSKGTLAVGADADVTLLDPGHQARVDVSRFQSKGRNSPFDGWRLRGWPVATVVGGRLVHQQQSFPRR